VPLTVSSAEATASAGGSLTYGDPHLSTDDSGHLLTNTAPANGSGPSAHQQVLTPVLATGARTRLSQNTNTALAAYDVLCDPPSPVQPAAQEGLGRGRPAHGATNTHAADGQPCSAPAVGGGTGSSTRAAQAGEPDTRQLTAPRTANTLLPRTLREGAGRCPHGGGTQLGAPSSLARMMNILEHYRKRLNFRGPKTHENKPKPTKIAPKNKFDENRQLFPSVPTKTTYICRLPQGRRK
jgi:hypothetical protein